MKLKEQPERPIIPLHNYNGRSRQTRRGCGVRGEVGCLAKEVGGKERMEGVSETEGKEMKSEERKVGKGLVRGSEGEEITGNVLGMEGWKKSK